MEKEGEKKKIYIYIYILTEYILIYNSLKACYPQQIMKVKEKKK